MLAGTCFDHCLHSIWSFSEHFEGKVWVFIILDPQGPVLSAAWSEKGIWEEELGCWVQILPCHSSAV